MGAPREFPIVHNSLYIASVSIGSGSSMEGCPESAATGRLYARERERGSNFYYPAPRCPCPLPYSMDLGDFRMLLVAHLDSKMKR